MQIKFELYELKRLCADMAALGAATYMKNQAPAKDLISQRQAFERFQKAKVLRWLYNGDIQTYREGAAINSPKYYSTAELMAMENAERLKYIFNR